MCVCMGYKTFYGSFRSGATSENAFIGILAPDTIDISWGKKSSNGQHVKIIDNYWNNLFIYVD